MTTSSAIPDRLTGFGTSQRHVAERLLLKVGALGDAERRLHETCPPDLLGSVRLPASVVDDLRATARRLLALADDTAVLGTAFTRADTNGATSRRVVTTTRTLIDVVSTLDTTGGIVADLANLSPAERHTLLSGIGGTTIARLVAYHPIIIGNTDGVPWRIRLAANHQSVLRALADARAAHDHELVALTERLANAQVLVFDPSHKRVAVVHGNLDAATNVAVFVPGMGSSFTGFFTGNNGTDNKAAAIFEAAEENELGTNAVISWLGYPAPPPVEDPVGALLHVPFADDAREGAHLLETLIDGLTLAPRQRTVLVGHSYGTLVIGLALTNGLHVDDVVLAGSPGIGVDHASTLQGSVSGHLSVLSAPGDEVAALAYFGADPDRPSFGARRLKANAEGKPPVTGHSRYFTPGSAALANVAAVVSGGRTVTQRPSALDRLTDGATTTTEAMDPGLTMVERLTGRYEGPGDRMVHGVGTVARQAEAAPAHALEATGTVIETAGKGAVSIWNRFAK